MMTMTNVRRATPEDAPAIAAVKLACWPDEAVDATHIAGIIAEPDHATMVVVVDGILVGFVDGFLTLASEGTRRWEIDLLAVDPESQGRGLGRVLIGACFGTGRRFAPRFARALIALDNMASQHAFARAQFTRQPGALSLMIATDGTDRAAPAPPDAHLIPVQTLGYRGVWLEGTRTPEAFAAARTVRARFGWETAGTLIPHTRPDLQARGEASGFTPVGDFEWWVRPYG